ncbi:hypothetical protein RHSIM_Rhsim11G0149200 [Rhododendron simsii]|uniref:MADS-box domain-containing protein n=1 Tax=Rhododendron simsii TaxID=118357 RepID=A0A834G8D8_RHOSS|nr:hypothetical protein RHSIM_Rhsim11G0149200 [Rhododendron simsii]
MAKKPSMGRQKIKIAKIEIKNHLQVTFSKRRSGLFKKASELCTLCGVEIAILKPSTKLHHAAPYRGSLERCEWLIQLRPNPIRPILVLQQILIMSIILAMAMDVSEFS